MPLIMLKKCNSIWLIVSSIFIWIFALLFEIFIHPTFSKMIVEVHTEEWYFNSMVSKFAFKYLLIVIGLWIYYVYNNRKLRSGTGGSLKVSLALLSSFHLVGLLLLSSAFVSTTQAAMTVPYAFMRIEQLEKKVLKLTPATQPLNSRPEGMSAGQPPLKK